MLVKSIKDYRKNNKLATCANRILGYRIRNTQSKTAAKPVVGITRISQASSGDHRNLIQTQSTRSHTIYPPEAPQSNSVARRSRFSPPPSTLGKRYAPALPSLACLGRASSGTGWPCRGDRITSQSGATGDLAGWQHAAGAGVISSVRDAVGPEGGFRPKAGRP